MRNPEQTIGILIDSQGNCYVGSIDAEGFPNIKAIRENPKAAVDFCDRRFAEA